MITNSDVCIGCPNGWGVFEDRCYRFWTSRKGSYTNAVNFCTSQGAEMICVDSQAEMDYLEQL